MDAPGNDGNASMSEQVKRPNPWKKKKKKKMMMMMVNQVYLVQEIGCPVSQAVGRLSGTA